MSPWFVCENCKGHIDPRDAGNFAIANKEETRAELRKYVHLDCHKKLSNMAEIHLGKKYWSERFGAKL